MSIAGASFFPRHACWPRFLSCPLTPQTSPLELRVLTDSLLCVPSLSAQHGPAGAHSWCCLVPSIRGFSAWSHSSPLTNSQCCSHPTSHSSSLGDETPAHSSGHFTDQPLPWTLVHADIHWVITQWSLADFFFFPVASLHVSKEPPLRLCSPAHYSVQCILVVDLCLLSPLKRHPSHQPSSLDKLHSDQKYQLSDTIWPYHITTKCYQYFCMYFISLLTSKSKNYGKIVSCWLWDPLILGTNLNHFTIIFLPKAHIIV